MMHQSLDRVWEEVSRRTSAGGVACINVGDATRTLGGVFRLYSNHSRIERVMEGYGFSPLPEVLWRKTSNKPNKFMGSGMLPPGAYVTQEHEYILIFRKGGKREFGAGSASRSRSAYFWEERNRWFSDLWQDLKGERQAMRGAGRERSASYPLELPYRLVSMFSVQGDAVYDPFLGTGTTTLAAMATARNSVSREIDVSMPPVIRGRLLAAVETANTFNRERLKNHTEFASSRKDMGYTNENYGFSVMTKHETNIEVPKLESVTEEDEGKFVVDYSDEPFSAEELR
jgi:DNA modification methylase